MSALPHPAITAAAIAFAIAAVLTPVVRALCVRLQIFDAPGPLKIHTQPVPRLGGVAIFIAIFTATIVTAPSKGTSIAAFLAAITLVWLAGFIDDLRDLSPALRVAAQFAAGVLIWLGGWHILIFGSGFLGLITVSFAVPVFANGLNLLDGMDALAAGTTVIIAATYLALPHRALSLFGYAVAASVVGACAGFLPYNWPRAKIFQGDCGATLVGCAIAFLALDSCHAAPTSPSTFAFVVLVALVPLLDAVLAAIRRLRSRRSALFGDRAHGYDLLRARGHSVPATLSVLYGITAALSGLGLLLVYRPSETIAAAAAISVGILISSAIKLGSIRKDGFPGIASLPAGGFVPAAQKTIGLNRLNEPNS